ncbi:NAD(P)H-binding protein [Variovorax sp. ZS18.2.2]|uniref:NAD(P)H-binding protein n=1 Tax=Variovorax sp. ZS18.2.2 TaxID=2971255 RepID=UPI002151921B|nr:NAD(P)H-binding protein [Variovorax sp. ZS18.2.2]MCR6475830.1 NAD(P)H-binding protein [Variovorax sp. ZS18.2.2]
MAISSSTRDDVHPILVLGANGKTGGRVLDRLRAAGHAVRVGSRSAHPRFDWEDRATWTAALEDVRAVYVAYQPDLCVPGAVETVTAFYAAAAKAGVERVVLLSGRGEPEAQDAEKALQATTLDWTIVRASWFFQNFSENYFLDEIVAGAITLPEGLAPEPFIDADDIADIAAEALVDSRHSRKLYELTGSQAFTFPEAIAEIGRATNRQIDCNIISMDEYAKVLSEAGLPPDLSWLVIYLFTTVLDGRNTPIAHGVEQALGRPPRTFADYVARTAPTGVWGAK